MKRNLIEPLKKIDAITLEGTHKAPNKGIAIVAAKFNSRITNALVDGALSALKTVAVTPSIVWVPGAFEIPLIAQKLAQTHQFDAIICLGAVIRGDTPHFDYVAGECARGIAETSRLENIPIIFGVLTTNTEQEAKDRCQNNDTNKGYESALTALEIADLGNQITALT